jgi:2-polyprenyl-6-methoxyphenol hydroxylase-like FAD-dependent oxidoreductase
MATSGGLKVIIIGGGVAGLAISHAFQKANINHVVLEKGVVAPQWGASITIWAHGARILQQLGCLDALSAQALPMKMMYCRDCNGKAFSADNYFEMMTER